MNDETGQGYTVTNIEYTDLSYPTGVEDFVYTVEDGDGDIDSAHLYITSDAHIVDGDSGNVLTGDAGDNIIEGLGGEDTLIAGLGNDILVGGDDADAFVFSANAGEGSNIITDFDPSVDKLSFADLLDSGEPGLGDDTFAIEDVGVTVDGNDLVLTITDSTGTNADTVVTLSGLGNDYAAYDGGSLADLVNGVDSNPTLNADTYSS